MLLMLSVPPESIGLSCPTLKSGAAHAPHDQSPREESNLDIRLRSPTFYPLNYEGADGAGSVE